MVVALLAISGVVYATTTSFDEVDVGVDIPHTVTGGSLAVGNDNQSSYKSLATGSYSFAHNNSFTAGHTNKAHIMSGAVGYLNNVNVGSSSYPRSAFAAGTINTVYGSDSVAFGHGNDIAASYSSAMGKGLLITTNKTNVVGEYNEDTVGADMRFVVGNGDSGSRSNAFEVHKDGSVIINQSQGDIDMGGFGTP